MERNKTGLTGKEVAKLDPFGEREREASKELEGLLGKMTERGKGLFFNSETRKNLEKLDYEVFNLTGMTLLDLQKTDTHLSANGQIVEALGKSRSIMGEVAIKRIAIDPNNGGVTGFIRPKDRTISEAKAVIEENYDEDYFESVDLRGIKAIVGSAADYAEVAAQSAIKKGLPDWKSDFLVTSDVVSGNVIIINTKQYIKSDKAIILSSYDPTIFFRNTFFVEPLLVPKPQEPRRQRTWRGYKRIRHV